MLFNLVFDEILAGKQFIINDSLSSFYVFLSDESAQNLLTVKARDAEIFS